MKKATLLVAMTMVAAAASAQYSVNPGAATVLDAGKVSTLGYVALDLTTIAKFQQQGADIIEYGPNDMTRFLYYWEETFVPGDGSYPGVDDQFDGYASLVVSDKGWSGAGYNINKGAGVNTSWWNDKTRFHLAYMAPGTAPASVAFIIAEGDLAGSSAAKVAIGNAFNDNGAIFPTIGPAAKDDWQGIDISFGDLRKLYPTFTYVASAEWTGNILDVLAGGVTGQTIALDAIYFYQPAGTDGVAEAEAEAGFVVTGRTVSVMNAAGIELYDMSGKLVKKTAGTTLGLDNLTSGVYVAKAGDAVRKIAIR